MSINPIQDYLVAAEAAYKGQKCLDKNFGVVDSIDHRGSAEELVGFLKEKNVILSKDPNQVKDLTKLFVYLGLLYKDSLEDRLILNWMRESIQLIQNPEEYAEQLQKVTSIFYMVRQFHSRWSGRFSSVERGISLALEMRQSETITVDGPEAFTERFQWHLPSVSSRKGVAFLAAFASVNQKKAGVKSESWFSFLMKHSNSADPEVKRVASYLLAHCEYHEKTYQRSVWSMNPELKAKVNGDWANTTERYFTTLAAATQAVLDFYGTNGKHDCFFKYDKNSLKGAVTALEKFGALGIEIENLVRCYGFFRDELNATCHRLHKSQVQVQRYKKVYGEETFLPFVEDYAKIRPERLSAPPKLPQPPPKKAVQESEKTAEDLALPAASSSYQHREEQAAASIAAPQDLAGSITSNSYKYTEEKAVSSIPATEVEVLEDEVEVSTQKPDWRKQIGLTTSDSVTLDYPYHVTRWFTDLENALSEEPYCSQTPKQQERSIFAHAFPLFVDQFVGTSYCHQGKYYNSRTKSHDTLYSIPVEVRNPDGSVLRGVCQYAIDATTGVCYHRCIRSQHPDAFVQSFFNKRVWDEVDFPPLQKATQDSRKRRLKLKAEEVTFLYDLEFGSVTFKAGSTRLTLFRMNEQKSETR